MYREREERGRGEEKEEDRREGERERERESVFFCCFFFAGSHEDVENIVRAAWQQNVCIVPFGGVYRCHSNQEAWQQKGHSHSLTF